MFFLFLLFFFLPEGEINCGGWGGLFASEVYPELGADLGVVGIQMEGVFGGGLYACMGWLSAWRRGRDRVVVM